MAWPRFYCEHLPLAGSFSLDEDESRHASSVLRMAVGDTCLAFDGCGGEARCTIHSMSKRAVEVMIDTRVNTDRELRTPLHFCVALPKGDRQKTLIDFLVQLGVHTLQPLVSHRSVAQPVDSALARLRRGVIEASKQCGRNHLMKIDDPISIEQLCQPSARSDSLRLVAHPYGEITSLKQLNLQIVKAPAITMLIGPEGGFTEDEVNSLRTSNWTAVGLGPRILRVEAAANYAAAYLAESSSEEFRECIDRSFSFSVANS